MFHSYYIFFFLWKREHSCLEIEFEESSPPKLPEQRYLPSLGNDSGMQKLNPQSS